MYQGIAADLDADGFCVISGDTIVIKDFPVGKIQVAENWRCLKFNVGTGCVNTIDIAETITTVAKVLW